MCLAYPDTRFILDTPTSRTVLISNAIKDAVVNQLLQPREQKQRTDYC